MLTLIASVGRNRVIGKGGGQPLYLKADLQRFKQLTLGHAVVMGRKTFESILRKLGKPLPGRTNIIVSSQKNYSAPQGCIVCNSIGEALAEARKQGGEVFVIGGAQIFEQSISLADKLEFTEIDSDLDGDVLFPEISEAEWRETSRQEGQEDGVKFAYVTYVRK